MSLAELLPEVSSLTRQDKVSLLRFLTDDLAAMDGTLEIAGRSNFAVWSPYEAFEAARTLQQALDAEASHS